MALCGGSPTWHSLATRLAVGFVAAFVSTCVLSAARGDSMARHAPTRHLRGEGGEGEGVLLDMPMRTDDSSNGNTKPPWISDLPTGPDGVDMPFTIINASGTNQTGLCPAGCTSIDSVKPWHHHVHHHVRHHAVRHHGEAIVLFFVHIVLLILCAILVLHYRSPALGEKQPETGRVVFGYGLFDEKEWWGEDFMLCATSFFCWPVQWAETVTKDKVGLLNNFWLALGITVLGFQEVNHIFKGVAHLIFICIAVYYRQKLREKFGLQSGTVETYMLDCLTWCCCPWCAAAQEARQVEHYATVDGPYATETGAMLTFDRQQNNNAAREPVVGPPLTRESTISSDNL